MTAMNAGTAAIFDLDGTLLDSMGVWDRVDTEFLARRGLDVPSDYMETIAAMQFRDIATYTIERFDLVGEREEDLMDEWTRLALHDYTTMVEPKAGALDYLHHLRDTGAKLAVATSMMPQLRGPALEHAGMADLFDAVVGVEEVAHGKQDPDIYLEAAARCGVDATQCTVFEDILPGIESARRAGMQAWGVQDDSSRRQWRRICEVADGVLSDFTQAPRALR
ncbi:hydrolyase [Bifidobacterium cuniculi]|uniref:Hydrolyase n=2 Tax=Bifidobacterium cuniculi TaxID=1688 RepID=A0A087AQC9_9BIFI|nr:hydrolyase [Bifidobacterium cuniculi]